MLINRNQSMEVKHELRTSQDFESSNTDSEIICLRYLWQSSIELQPRSDTLQYYPVAKLHPIPAHCKTANHNTNSHRF